MQILHRTSWPNAGCGKGEPSENGDSLFNRQATKGQQ